MAVKDVPSDLRLLDMKVRVDLAPDDTTHKRLRACVDDLQNRRVLSSGNRLIDVVFGDQTPGRVGPSEAASISESFTPFDPLLNDAQLNVRGCRWLCSVSQFDIVQAIEFALCARDIACIHGPPGTGKTTAVAELVRQMVLRFAPRAPESTCSFFLFFFWF